MPGYLYFGFRPEDGIHEAYCKLIVKIGPSPGPRLLPSPSAEAEKFLEYVSETGEYVSEIPKTGKPGLLKSRMTELIV